MLYVPHWRKNEMLVRVGKKKVLYTRVKDIFVDFFFFVVVWIYVLTCLILKRWALSTFLCYALIGISFCEHLIILVCTSILAGVNCVIISSTTQTYCYVGILISYINIVCSLNWKMKVSRSKTISLIHLEHMELFPIRNL